MAFRILVLLLFTSVAYGQYGAQPHKGQDWYKARQMKYLAAQKAYDEAFMEFAEINNRYCELLKQRRRFLILGNSIDVELAMTRGQLLEAGKTFRQRAKQLKEAVADMVGSVKHLPRG